MLTMLDLPQDIFIHVVAFLDIQDLSRIARTCHTLNRCSCDDYIWKYMYTLEYGTCTIKEQDISSWKEKCAFRRKARATDVESFNGTPTYLPGMNELEEGGTPQYKMEKYAVKFLQDPRITRVARGVYLSITDKKTHGVLDSYFETLDFGGQSVLESLTYLLQFIQFPPHFSVITKFMLAFAQRYYTCNSNSIFRNFDAVYVLAFGIIMLNTDMHNSAVKNKMTLAQYISNCSGINGGENLPEKMLTDIYTKVKEKSLVINRTTPTSQYDSSLWSWVSDWLYKLKK